MDNKQKYDEYFLDKVHTLLKYPENEIVEFKSAKK